MKSRRTGAFTRLDLLCLTIVLTFVASFLVAASQYNRKQALEAGCVFNLRELGIAAFSWSSDHNETFPWHLSPVNGFGPFIQDGSSGIANAWQHYWVMRKEIGDPGRVWCPADNTKKPAEHWGRERNGFPNSEKQNNSVSYFIGIHAAGPSGNNPIFGDRNIEGGAQGTICAFLPGIPVATQLNSRPELRWGTNLHGGNSGNLVLSDGSVLQSTDQILREAVEKAEAREGNRNFHVLPPQ